VVRESDLVRSGRRIVMRRRSTSVGVVVWCRSVGIMMWRRCVSVVVGCSCVSVVVSVVMSGRSMLQTPGGLSRVRTMSGSVRRVRRIERRKVVPKPICVVSGVVQIRAWVRVWRWVGVLQRCLLRSVGL